jgi:hypothetical protein
VLFTCVFRSQTQLFDFVRFQATAFPLGEPIQPDGTNGDAFECEDLVADLGKHPANLAILSFRENDFEPGTFALGFHDFYMTGAGFSVAKPDSIG